MVRAPWRRRPVISSLEALYMMICMRVVPLWGIDRARRGVDLRRCKPCRDIRNGDLNLGVDLHAGT